MEPTQIKRGSIHGELVRVGDGSSLSEAHQRAPTLMGGAEAGSGGQVQLWAPDTALVRKQAYRAGAAISFYLLGTMFLLWLTLQFASGSLSPLAWIISLALFVIPSCSILLFGMMMSPAIPAMRRKRYFTTDDAGFGITTRKASRYLAWEDVVMLQSAYPWGLRLRVCSGENVEVNLPGYPAAARKELLERIIERAGLVPLQGWYLLPGEKYYALPGYQFSPVTGKLLPPATMPAIPAPAIED